MKTSTPSVLSTPSSPGVCFVRGRLAALVAAVVFSVSAPALLAQTTGTAPGGDRPRRTDGGGGGDRGNFNPQDMQARMLNALRERLEVTDDEEWKLISARIMKVSELRRSTGAGIGGFAGRGPGGGGGGGGGDGGRGTRTNGGPGGGGSPEVAALSSALRDKLPDAEIKSRLDRLRESRKENEVKLAKAQEELRAVLSIRQEAVAVVFGLLP